MKSLLKKRSEPFVYHHYYLKVQKIWAEKMKVIAGKMSRKKLICSLVLFTVMSCGYLVYNLYQSFNNDDKASKKTVVKSQIKYQFKK